MALEFPGLLWALTLWFQCGHTSLSTIQVEQLTARVSPQRDHDHNCHGGLARCHVQLFCIGSFLMPTSQVKKLRLSTSKVMDPGSPGRKVPNPVSYPGLCGCWSWGLMHRVMLSLFCPLSALLFMPGFAPFLLHTYLGYHLYPSQPSKTFPLCSAVPTILA